MTSPDVKDPEGHPPLTTQPFLGIAGVLLGAMFATCTGRLMNVGLADIRGALHLALGGVFIGHFIAIREEFHSNMLGLSVQLGNVLPDHRILLGHGFVTHSSGLTAVGRAAEVLGLQVRQQALTVAVSDSFLLVAACCVACLVLVAFMTWVPTQYREVVSVPVGAK